jgi:hypothetical protein
VGSSENEGGFLRNNNCIIIIHIVIIAEMSCSEYISIFSITAAEGGGDTENSNITLKYIFRNNY